MSLESQIESLLFYKSEPVTKAFLAEFFEVTADAIHAAVVSLQASLQDRGVQLVTTDTAVQLVTASGAHDLIERLRKEELSSDIGKAGAETLAIIVYRGPLSRAEIDRIRGVNSTFILRNLLIRGLIERRAHPTDSRSWTYAVTPALLNHLGVATRESLPEFAAIMNALDAFDAREQRADETPQNPLISG